MVGNFFPRYRHGPQPTTAPDFGGNSGGASYIRKTSESATLATGLGTVSHLLQHDFERERAQLFFDAFGQKLPYRYYAVASVVAKLETDHGQHPTEECVIQELKKFLGDVSYPTASEAIDGAVTNDTVSRDPPGTTKRKMYLGDRQRQRLKDFERRQKALFLDYAKKLGTL
ncbi:hypothetical protein GOB50_31065 [Sinorhizobium meliloti]|nr:hypothetical protein [Sinorhizobium meliloti]MDX1010491.1 hypothetical protein [Sinorhizobium medicae]